jgi:hypothetical protein
MPAGGGLLQLVATGKQDVFLTGNPQISFFKMVYRRHTNFATECQPMYFDGTPNPDFGKTISMVSFHQGLDNAVKSSKSNTHATYGGQSYLDRKNNIKRQINPTADTRIVETTLVDGKTYRNFKTTYIDHNGQVATTK